MRGKKAKAIRALAREASSPGEPVVAYKRHGDGSIRVREGSLRGRYLRLRGVLA